MPAYSPDCFCQLPTILVHPVKIAYIILAHKLPDQLVRLVKKLNTGDTSFFIHVDKKSSYETYKRIADSLSVYKNVTFIKRYKTEWGQVSCIKAQLEGIEALLAGGNEFDYAINLSGQDYPIKSNNYIQKILRESSSASYLNYFSAPDPRAERWSVRHIKWHIVFGKHHFVLPRDYSLNHRF